MSLCNHKPIQIFLFVNFVYKHLLRILSIPLIYGLYWHQVFHSSSIYPFHLCRILSDCSYFAHDIVNLCLLSFLPGYLGKSLSILLTFWMNCH